MFAGPPCQGLSRSGKRHADDPRNELVFDFMRIVREIHRRSFVMDVPGMLDTVARDGVPVINALALMAQEGGMATFEAICRPLAETAGAALRNDDRRLRPPPAWLSGNGHVHLDDDQLPLFAQT